MVKRIHRFSGSNEFATEDLHFATGGSVGNNHGGGHVSHNAVTDHRGLGGDAADFGREGRDDEETPFLRRLAQVLGNLRQHAAGEAPDDRVLRAKKEAEALLLHRGMEAAHDGDTFFTKVLAKVVGVEDQLAGALDGAEKGDLGTVQDCRVTGGVNFTCFARLRFHHRTTPEQPLRREQACYRRV